MASAVEQAAVRARVPPSSFALLLRRSKFSSFDPRIGQIYTTFDGHAHRGDWGLKRPLAVRRRDAHLAIHTVDTLYQQTEWTSAHTDAVWLQKFERLGVTPRMKSPLGARDEPPLPWLADFDFARSDNDTKMFEGLEGRLAPEPNPHAMTEKRFKRYLKRLRKFSPEFEAFIEEKDRRTKSGIRKEIRDLLGNLSYGEERKEGKEEKKISMVQHARSNADNEDHHRFIAAKYMMEYKKPDSTFIRPLPHPAAGLTYASANDLQSIYAHAPVPGRRLMPAPPATPLLTDSSSSADNTQTYRTLVAGWVGSETVPRAPKDGKPKMTSTLTQLKAAQEALLKTVDFGTREGDPRTKLSEGTAWFRATDCQIERVPAVVGRYPARLGDEENGARIELRLMEWNAAARDEVANPYIPGTLEYLTYKKPPKAAPVRSTQPSMTNQPRPSHTRTNRQQKKSTKEGSREEARQSLLTNLDALQKGLPDELPEDLY